MHSPLQTRADRRPKTNAQRQKAWRDKHRARNRNAVIFCDPCGIPSSSGPIQPIYTRDNRRPMTNAERQRRWRQKHRGKRPRMQLDSPGEPIGNAA